MRPKATLAAAFLALALAACGSTQYDDDPLYDAGFSDGCATGTARTPGIPTKPVRDNSLWEQSEGYRAGWRAGYGSCSPGTRGDIPGADRDIGGR
jgi:hypothetical protein